MGKHAIGSNTLLQSLRASLFIYFSETSNKVEKERKRLEFGFFLFDKAYGTGPEYFK